MNQTSILQHNDILLRVEEQTYKLNRNDNYQQYSGSNGQNNTFSNQQSFINGINRQSNFNNLHRQSNFSQNGINVKDNNTVSYKVNIYQANNVHESRTQINAQYTSTHQNGSTLPNHQQLQKEDIQSKNIVQTLFSCQISWRLAIFIIIQLLEKFFFFTLFLYSITAASFQIIIGLIYGITSAAKYFLTIYTFNTDLTDNSQLNKDNSEDESVESQKLKICNKCEEKVSLECIHCDICEICVYKQFFHSKLLGKCICFNNKRMIQIIIGMNFIEGVIFVVIGVISIAKCLQDFESYKNDIIQLQKAQENPKSLSNIPGQPGSIQHITGGSTIFKQQQSINKTPTLVRSISGLGTLNKKKFESHWKISPPDGKQEAQQLVSMNSYGTIYNFISKKVASCENIEKIPTNSPSKSIKSLNSIDQSIFKKTRNKSQNLSKIDISNLFDKILCKLNFFQQQLESEFKKKQTHDNTLIV